MKTQALDLVKSAFSISKAFAGFKSGMKNPGKTTLGAKSIPETNSIKTGNSFAPGAERIDQRASFAKGQGLGKAVAANPLKAAGGTLAAGGMAGYALSPSDNTNTVNYI